MRARARSIPATRPPAPRRALDAFLLPDVAAVRRVQRRVAGRRSATPSGCASCSTPQPVMARFRERFDARFFTADRGAAGGAARELSRVGRPRQPAAIADRRLARGADLERFEILRDAFAALGVPTVVCDPRDLVVRRHAAPGRRGTARRDRPRLPPRPHQRHRSRGPTSAGRWSRPTAPRRLRRQHAALQDPAQEGVLRGPDRRPVSGAVFRRGARRRSRRHVPWTRLVEERRVTVDGERSICLVSARAARAVRAQAERRIRRHRRDARLGNAAAPTGTRRSRRALAERARGWVVQRRIAVRRELFPRLRRSRQGAIVERDMLVDFAPYLFRGQAGRLPDPPERHRASPTSPPAAARCRPSSSVGRSKSELMHMTSVFGPLVGRSRPRRAQRRRGVPWHPARRARRADRRPRERRGRRHHRRRCSTRSARPAIGADRRRDARGR